MKNWFIRLHCRLFGHAWDHAPEQHSCGCIDRIWICSHCGKTNATPFFRLYGCPAHDVDLQSFAKSFARLK